jgi:hypothetical protein
MKCFTPYNLEINMRKRTLVICSCVLLLLLSACGGGSNETSIPPAGGASGAPSGPAAPPATATLSGKILFEGTPPANAKIQMTADPYCAKSSDNPMTEDYKVSDGGLENVIVYVSSPVNASFPTPTEAMEIDQTHCHYVPHVFTIMVNQPLKIKNNDETLHNIHSFSEVNEQYNVGQAMKGMVNDTKFTKAEMPVPFKCDVHKWMSAFAGVFTHPYHTVSKGGGAYEIKLAPGSYEITAWHEKLGPMKQTIDVKDGSNELNFTFKPTSAD